jgi:hypothetical protein
VTSECGYSKATIVVKNVTLPLAWSSDEYFGAKRGRLPTIKTPYSLFRKADLYCSTFDQDPGWKRILLQAR